LPWPIRLTSSARRHVYIRSDSMLLGGVGLSRSRHCDATSPCRQHASLQKQCNVRLPSPNKQRVSLRQIPPSRLNQCGKIQSVEDPKCCRSKELENVDAARPTARTLRACSCSRVLPSARPNGSSAATPHHLHAHIVLPIDDGSRRSSAAFIWRSGLDMR